MIIKSKNERFKKTVEFMHNSIHQDNKILDLGIENVLSEYIKEKGYNITNTSGEDLDIDYEIVKDDAYDVITAFEIFEHMLCPFNLLREIKANTLIASVPLKLWFAKAYWSSSDERDRHYHEFEIKQFNFLLEKTGWEIVKYEKWKSVSYNFGIRPFLRFFVPRYYIVHCIRKKA